MIATIAPKMATETPGSGSQIFAHTAHPAPIAPKTNATVLPFQMRSTFRSHVSMPDILSSGTTSRKADNLPDRANSSLSSILRQWDNGRMDRNTPTPFEKFTKLVGQIAQVPGSEVKKKIEEEQKKKRKAKPSASSRDSGERR
jgi:hypothetical protein